MQNEEKKMTTFELLNNINLSDKIEQKMGLNYLSWANAWALLKKNCPDASYKIYTRTEEYTTTEVIEDTQFSTTRTTVTKGTREIPYFTDGKTTYVQVGVTVDGVEYVEYYPIMNLKNSAVSLAGVTMTDVNKAIQRAFVKACARHGLGLYIYTGEDLPEVDKPKPVDYTNVIEEVNNMKVVELTADQIATMAQTLGTDIGSLPEQKKTVALNYLKQLVTTYKVEKVSQHPEALQKACELVNRIK